MKYLAAFREIVESDMGRDCDSMPTPDEFEMHFHAIAQDIEILNGVADVTHQGDRALMITTDGLDLKTLKDSLKPILQYHFDYVRISSIDPL